MAFVARLKRWIKSHPVGLYYTERRKKRVYEAMLRTHDDRAFIEWLYRKKNKDLPLRLEDPQTFTEKLQWLKLYYRDERMTRCSDKAEIKDVLRENGMGDLAVPTLALYDTAEEIDENALPERFVLKATHGCGWQWVCRGDNTAIDWKWAKKTMAVWLSESLYIFGREWNYKEQPPRMMLEPLLSEKPLTEYKFMCFNGTARVVQINHERDGIRYVDFYDSDWQLLKGVHIAEYPCSDVAFEKPARYEEMLCIAQRLAQPFPFVRVDMYAVDDRLYVGEMTFFTGAGFHPFKPLEWDRRFGEWLTLPEKNDP